jgi:glycosyltransferase involved in cell wall biosynthesis
MLKDILEIFLITYNRKIYLQKTFNQIFANSSPIKNFDITILNNKSTDGTTELIEKYREKFNNIKHIIHNRNIGGNANIARAFELATKNMSGYYVTMICLILLIGIK